MNLRYFNPLQWRRSLLAGLLLVLLGIWFGFIDTYSLKTRVQLHQEKNELIRETERLRQETLDYEQKLEDLSSSPGLLEQIAREDYGMRKPGETIYRIKDK